MPEFVLSAFADEISKDLKTQMDVLEQNDVQYIEMRGVNGKSLVKHSLEEVKEIKRQIDERGFKISAVGSPIGKIDIREEFGPHLDLFRHTMEIGGILETKYIRMFSFFIPEGEDPAKYRDEVMERWSMFIRAAEGRGFVLLHENEKDIYGDTPERCLDLLRTMKCSYMKAVFDPANFIQRDVETYPKAFEMLNEYIAYMHIKDARYSDHVVVPSGYGDGRVKEILSALYERGFEGFLSLEPHLKAFEGFETLERSLMKNVTTTGDGAGKFVVALNALRKILDEIEGKGK